MKKLLAVIFVLALAPMAFAQNNAIDAGSMIIGGNIYFTSYSGDLHKDDKSPLYGKTAYGLVPSLQYFVIPGLAVGAQLKYEGTKNPEDFKFTKYGIGPVAAFYITAAENIYPFAQIAFNYEKWKIDTEKATYWTLPLSVGCVFMVSKQVGINAEFAYTFENAKPDGGSSIKGRTMDLRLGVKAFIL